MEKTCLKCGIGNGGSAGDWRIALCTPGSERPLQDRAEIRGRPIHAPASWSAVAKRSGDTAFARTSRLRTPWRLRPRKSAVAAIALPAHSKTLARLSGGFENPPGLGVRRRAPLCVATACATKPESSTGSKAALLRAHSKTLACPSRCPWRLARELISSLPGKILLWRAVCIGFNPASGFGWSGLARKSGRQIATAGSSAGRISAARNRWKS